MAADPPTERSSRTGTVRPGNGEEIERRRRAVVAGHRGDEGAARAALTDPSPAVRAAGFGALARQGALRTADVTSALADEDSEVRRRACELATRLGSAATDPLAAPLRSALGDRDPLVVEAACWALGELGDAGAVGALGEVSRRHPDARCREAAVAALGAVGHPDGLADVLARLDDRPAVRRRAVVALAAFDDPAAEGALRRALDDRDWQVRQAAEILLDE